MKGLVIPIINFRHRPKFCQPNPILKIILHVKQKCPTQCLFLREAAVAMNIKHCEVY